MMPGTAELTELLFADVQVTEQTRHLHPVVRLHDLKAPGRPLDFASSGRWMSTIQKETGAAVLLIRAEAGHKRFAVQQVRGVRHGALSTIDRSRCDSCRTQGVLFRTDGPPSRADHEVNRLPSALIAAMKLGRIVSS
jgi:hypothetical protein